MLFVGASGNDPKNDFELFLRNYAWALCVAVVVVILVTILVIFVFKNKKTPKKKKVESKATANEWIDAMGGKDNIVEVYSMGSRLSVKLVDVNLVNREVLASLGVSNVVQMSNKITLVTNLDNEKVVDRINQEIMQK